MLYAPVRSLIDQSLQAELGSVPANGDGFGLGWYDTTPVPVVFRSIEPAWSDLNLRELAGHLVSPLFFAHIRAAVGSPVQKTNCHPFRHGQWLFMHNGHIESFATIKRDLTFAVDPSLYPQIDGSTDSEVLFYLALTFGLADDPPSAVARAIGLVEECGHARGITHPFQGTVATADGQTMWTFRYSSDGRSPSLFFTHDIEKVRERYPDEEMLQGVGEGAQLVVSEPIGDLPGAWAQMPEATCRVAAGDGDELMPFAPRSLSAR
jgi:predicted glutamine amidotransferase